MLLLALYKSCVSQSGVSIYDPNGHKVELVFVKAFLTTCCVHKTMNMVGQWFCPSCSLPP